MFWQGLYEDSRNNLNQPLLGIWSMNRSTVLCVTETITQLQQQVVKIVPFSKLVVDTSHYFSGGSARVYVGSFENKEVAIKFLFCMELTPERVIEFCNEATLLNSLQHPNIVQCIGVSIMPPAICLVTEFCTHGSLFDFLHKSDFVLIDNNYRFSKSSRGFANHSSYNIESSKSSKVKSRSLLRPMASDSDVFDKSNNSTYQHNDAKQDRNNELDNLVIVSTDIPDDVCSSMLANLVQMSSVDGTSMTHGSISNSMANSNFDLDTNFGYGREHQLSSKLVMNPMAATPRLSDRSSLVSENSDVATKLVEAMTNHGITSVAESSFRGSMGSIHQMKSRRLASTSGGLKSSGRFKSAGLLLLTSEMRFGLGPKDDNIDSNVRRGFQGLSSQGVHRNSLGLLLGVSGLSHSAKNNFLSYKVRLQMARDCCAGLSFLHSKNFMHCDIKSLNFLVASDLTVKLADLGEARMIESISDVRSLPRNLNWSSPELLLNQQNAVNQAADVWSLAMVIIEILSGEVPYDAMEYRNMSLEIFVELLKNDSRPSLPRYLEPASWLTEMLNSAWSFNSIDRCSATYLLSVFETNLKK
eukprot:gene4245-6024_t